MEDLKTLSSVGLEMHWHVRVLVLRDIKEQHRTESGCTYKYASECTIVSQNNTCSNI